MEVKLEVVGREVIKPASPSPLDRLQLSLADLTAPAVYVSTVFFYKAEDLVTVSPAIISANLKSSLSETLSRFYPLAGRIEGVSISCNDEGAVFTEARTDLLLPDFLKTLNIDSLEGFSPTMAPGDSPEEWPLLAVKATFFGSGSGVAVSVSVSHRICDAASLLSFATDWAATTAKKKSNDTIQFAETTICPPPPPTPHTSSQSSPTDSNTFILTSKCAANRFVFESSKIAELKRKAASESVPVPTRVEVISALVLRCARKAARSNVVVPKSTLLLHGMDLRLRIPSTTLSRDAIGNLQTAYFLKESAESDLEICETVAALRKAKEGVNEVIKENLKSNTLGQYVLSVWGNLASEVKPDVDLFTMSSWCRKPFYEVDFGWGRPVWLGSASRNVNIVCVVLVDLKDSEGVEAWISLLEQDMSMLLRDQEFLEYAVINPPILI